ncbi:MAG: CHASE domain-containing protein [Verrucomicrobiia bacterium]
MESSKKRHFDYRAAIFVFLLVAICTFLTSYITYRGIKRDSEEEFKAIARDASENVSSELSHYLTMLQGISAFFLASEDVTPEEWTTYIDFIKRSQRYNGIRSIAFLPAVKSSDLNRFLETARKEVNPEYKIYPPGARSLYFPVYYLSSFTETDQFIGFDYYTVPERRAVIDEAIKNGEQRATGKLKFTFPSGTNYSAGIAIYTPVFKGSGSKTNVQESVVGVLSCSILAEQFFPGLIQPFKENTFYVEIFDGKQFTDDNLLFKTRPEGIANKPLFEFIESGKIAGRTFSIRFTSTPDYEGAINRILPIRIAVVGTAIGIILALVVAFQIRARKEAQELAKELEVSHSKLTKANEQLEKEIQEKNELLKQIEFERHLFDELLENIPDAVYFKDINSRFIKFSKNAVEKLGISQEEAVGKTDFDLFTEEHARAAFEDEQEIIRTGKPIIGKIEKETWKDGKITYAITTKMPYRDKDGKIIGTFGISKDITEVKQIQDKLNEERERLALTLNSIGDGVISTDAEGRVVIMNPIAERLTGWNSKDAQGKPLKEVFVIVNEQTRQPVEDPVEKVIKTGKICGLANNTMLISKDNVERIIADSAAPIKDSSGKIIGVVLVFRDVTDKHRYEQERINSARLETIERFAGGLAHDFNNILTAIMGNISLVKMMFDSSDQAFHLLDSAERSCVRAKNLTRQLLTFTKSGSPVKKTIEITPLLRQAVEMAVYSSSVTVKYDIKDELPLVEADDSQLGQAFTHLATFSVQTMPSGGSIFVSAETVVLDEQNSDKLEPGKYVKIVLQDHGEGIPKEQLARFFEPYYAHVGPGSGVGLAAAESIIRKHNGRVKVYSIVKKGTTFTIYLPATDKQPDKPKNIKGAPPEFRGKHILIMDDEENICILVKAILERFGMIVDTALNGEDTIRKYISAIRAGAPYDLVILDLTIQGGIGGKDVLVELKKHNPKVKAIVSSGYSFDPIMANYKEYGFAGVIQKPYSVDELKEVLIEVLEL